MNTKTRLIEIFVLLLIIASVVIAYIGFMPKKGVEYSPFEYNLYGDFLAGSVGGLLSLAGVLMIYVAFLAQKEELKEARQSHKQQQFESALFNLLKFHNGIRNELSHNDNKGIRYFKEMKADYDKRCNHLKKNHEDASQISYEEVVQAHYPEFEYYVNNLISILNYVKRHKLERREEYLEIVRNQISPDEKEMIKIYSTIYSEESNALAEVY